MGLLLGVWLAVRSSYRQLVWNDLREGCFLKATAGRVVGSSGSDGYNGGFDAQK